MLNRNSPDAQPLVSVIIPCFNRERYIKETVQSVLNQSWPNIELIVVDDGCTDGSRALLGSFGNALKILEHPGRVNRGQSAAINLGLAHCTGDYVAILDSDDLFLPKKIEKQVQYLADHEDIGLVYSNGFHVDEHGNVLWKIYDDKHFENSEVNRILLDCYFLIPNNSLFRKDLIEIVGGFDENLRAAQDHDMAIRMLEKSSVGYIDECLFCYRRHKDSISQKNAKMRWSNGYKILLKAVKRYDYPIFVILGRLAVLNFRLGQCFYEEKKYLFATLLFAAAGFCNPLRALKVIMGCERITSPH